MFIFDLIFNKLILNVYKLNVILNIFFFFIILFFFLFLLLSLLFNKKKLNYFKYLLTDNNFLEIVLFFIIFFFIILIFFISILIIFNFNYKKKINYFVTIKLISYQWKWYYNYINGYGNKINFFSCISTSIIDILSYNLKKKNYLIEVDKALVLPINRDIRFIFTSNDVIHSYFIPFLNIKQDLLPSYFNEKYFRFHSVGKYKGFCTELCGKNHSYMPIIINILSIFNYKKWVISKYFEKFLIFKY